MLVQAVVVALEGCPILPAEMVERMVDHQRSEQSCLPAAAVVVVVVLRRGRSEVLHRPGFGLVQTEPPPVLLEPLAARETVQRHHEQPRVAEVEEG